MKTMMYTILIALFLIPILAFSATPEETAKLDEDLKSLQKEKPAEEIKNFEQQLLDQRKQNETAPKQTTTVVIATETRQKTIGSIAIKEFFTLSFCSPYGYYTTQLEA